MGNSKPILGYPNKKAAIAALHAQGLMPGEIAAQVQSSTDAVRNVLREQARAAGEPARPKGGGKRQAEEAPPDTRGIWTLEKLDKAKRLFGKTMILIAEALQVPPGELLEYGLKGVIPPMGEKQRVAQLLDDLAASGTQPEPPAPPALPPPPAPEPEPSREDDEAALDQLEAEGEEGDAEPEPSPQDVAPWAQPGGPPPPPMYIPPDQNPEFKRIAAENAAAAIASVPPTLEAGHLYRLTDEAGQWLHESLEGLTKNRRFAWKGNTKQMTAVLQRHPNYKVLVPERAEP